MDVNGKRNFVLRNQSTVCAQEKARVIIQDSLAPLSLKSTFATNFRIQYPLPKFLYTNSRKLKVKMYPNYENLPTTIYPNPRIFKSKTTKNMRTSTSDPIDKYSPSRGGQIAILKHIIGYQRLEQQQRPSKQKSS